ncbi:MAG: hypothetical protein COA47_16165 [Robiginitomaculum sp.]|nr:MAG: hypothetical protein COA47_16165 [Robiginitomaculum sp.]
MIFRRIKAHVAKEDWFAVILDFFIVVAGVGMALMAEQWIGGRHARSDLAQAKIAIRGDLYDNYFNVKERISLAECRKVRTRELAHALSQPDAQWTGMPLIGYADGIASVFPPVLPATYRQWGSRIWDAEFQNGTFNGMDQERKQAMDSMFSMAKYMNVIQAKVYDTQARLRVLALTTDMTTSDRIKYYELLTYHDGQSSLIELGSQQIMLQIEGIGLDDDKAIHAQYSDLVTRFNTGQSEQLGECYTPIVLPFLEGNNEVKVTP